MTDTTQTKTTLLMTTSLKGGTGKSFFACALLDFLRASGHPIAAYDGDGSIGTLSAMHATRDSDGCLANPQDPLTGVTAYNVRDESRTMLIESSGLHTGSVLHDLAGGAVADLQRILGDEGGLHNLFQAFSDLNIHPVFCHLVTPDKATVESVAIHLDMLDKLGDLGCIAGHLAILNRRGMLKPGDYPFWYRTKQPDGREIGGKTRDRLLARGGIEMMLPHMDERVLALTKNSNMPLSRAVHEAPLGIVERQWIRQFAKEFADNVTPEVRAALGLQNA